MIPFIDRIRAQAFTNRFKWQVGRVSQTLSEQSVREPHTLRWTQNTHAKSVEIRSITVLVVANGRLHLDCNVLMHFNSISDAKTPTMQRCYFQCSRLSRYNTNSRQRIWISSAPFGEMDQASSRSFDSGCAQATRTRTQIVSSLHYVQQGADRTVHCEWA